MDLARTSPGAEITPSRDALEARVAELERIIGAVVECQSAAPRAAAPASDLDPVALTKALHPRGLRSARGPKRGRAGMRVRLFVFTPPDAQP